MRMSLFLAAIALLFLSAGTGALTRRGSIAAERLSLALCLSGCSLGLTAVLLVLAGKAGASCSLPWRLLPGAAICFKIDPLAAVFLLPALLITAAGALYGTGYWPAGAKPKSSAWLRFFYPLLSATILLLLASDNVYLFLVNWECMALTGYFLILTEREKEEAQRAGLVYLAATHTGTLALFGLFALLGPLSPGLHLPAAASLAGNNTTAGAIFLLALFGFGLKAGLIPLHIWLPGAHASAPSNVSALMSGVMIKMGIYGIVRVCSFFYEIPLWWGEAVLAAGIISAVFGVVWAIAQHDIKRLLAYHSVENIGIILLGLGVALIGRSADNAAMVALGLAGALLHVINHGLFKALLFLAAGSMIHATGTRRMTAFGGLLKSMPFTGLFFLGGAVAICGLPPLNGFVSEWLVYLGIFHSMQAGNPLIAMLAAPALAMTGGLALLCFAKVFGLSFLGESRSPSSTPEESPRSMLIAMALLFAACLWIGVEPLTLLPLLNGATRTWSGTSTPCNLAALAPAGLIGAAAFVLLLLCAAFFSRRFADRARHSRNVPTWGCGYALGITRVQYTTSSFAQLIVDFFGWFLHTATHRKKVAGILPREKAWLESHSPDLFLDLLLLPLAACFGGFAVRLRRFVQHGILGIYLLYSALVLLLLLYLAAR